MVLLYMMEVILDLVLDLVRDLARVLARVRVLDQEDQGMVGEGK